MPAISRQADTVFSPDGSGRRCRSAMETSVGEVNQNNVFANGLLIVNQGCQISAHPKAGCEPDESVLDLCSTKVFIGGKGVGRIGDKYGDNVITQGSPTVFAG